MYVSRVSVLILAWASDALIPKKRVGFRFELGCQFMGKMRVYQNDSELETNNVVKGKDDLSKWLDKLKVYPVLKFTLTGRIF